MWHPLRELLPELMQKTTQAPWKTFVPVPALGLLTLETFAWIPSFPPMNALDPSSYIFLHHHLLSLLTDWDPQLGCTVHVIIVVGEILSAAMSTTINQRKVKRFVKHAQVSGLCSSRNCARLCCHKTMFSSWVPTSYPMLGYVILRSLSLPRRDVPFIPYLTGTRILKLTSLVHPGYENYLVFQCSGNSTIATYLHMCWSSFA